MTQSRRLPVVTLILIAANIIAAFALLINPDLSETFGFRSDQPSVRTVFTSLFLHANVIHLLGNMVFLAAVGAAVELASGSFRFASVYFLSGIVGIAVHYLLSRHAFAPPPLIGASGAIAGCAAYYSFRYFGLRVPIAPKVGVSVLAIAGVWLVLQLVGAFVRLGEVGGTSYWAHLGGFAAGIVISLIFRAPDLGQAALSHEVLAKMNDRGPSAVAIVAERHLERHPGDVKALRELARANRQLGEDKAEAKALFQLLDVLPESEQPPVLERISELNRASEIPVLRRVLLADRFKAAAPDLSKHLLQTVIREKEESQRPEAMLALAELERATNEEKGRTILVALEQEYPLHPCVELARKRGWL